MAVSSTVHHVPQPLRREGHGTVLPSENENVNLSSLNKPGDFLVYILAGGPVPHRAQISSPYFRIRIFKCRALALSNHLVN